MQFFPPLIPSLPRPDPGFSIVISLLPSFLSPSAVISNFLLFSFENHNGDDDDDENEVNGDDGWDGREKRETVVMEGFRERGMDPEGRECKILQPRGTHGDVISTTEPETYYNSHNPPTTKSLGSHV